MAMKKRTKTPLADIDARPALPRSPVPYGFVLDAIAQVEPTSRAMFGALAVYVGEKIVFLLRNSKKDPQANGVWVAIPPEHQDSIRSEFPNARPVRMMGKDIKGWCLLSSDADDFEESAVRACELILKSDHRIGKVPHRK